MNTHTTQVLDTLKAARRKMLKTLPTIPLYSRQYGKKKTNFVKIKQNGTTKTHEKTDETRN